MRRILVTGATGFIGKRLMSVLREQGYDGVPMVRDDGERLDLTDAGDVRAFLAASGPFAATVHLAARIPVASDGMAEDDEALRASNIAALETFLTEGGDALGHFIYASSIDVYGNSPSVPYLEDAALSPATLYGASKVAGESLVGTWARVRSAPVTILRFSQVYGWGEAPIKAIPRFIECIRSGTPVPLVAGGTDRRRYLEVTDAVRAIVHVIHAGKEGTFNIAGEETVSMLGLVRILERALGKTVGIVTATGTATGDRFQSIQKAREELGYSATVTLEDGLRTYAKDAGIL